MVLFFKIFSAIHVALYQLTGGRFGGEMRGIGILILFTKGRKSGKKQAKPLMYIRDGESYAIAASAMGSDKHPSWYWNAAKGSHPVEIQVMDKQIVVNVSEADNEMREELYQRFTDLMDDYRQYQDKTERKIPVVILTPQS